MYNYHGSTSILMGLMHTVSIKIHAQQLIFNAQGHSDIADTLGPATLSFVKMCLGVLALLGDQCLVLGSLSFVERLSSSHSVHFRRSLMKFELCFFKMIVYTCRIGPRCRIWAKVSKHRLLITSS